MDDLRALNNKQLALFLILNCEPGAVGRPARRNISPVSLHRHRTVSVCPVATSNIWISKSPSGVFRPSIATGTAANRLPSGLRYTCGQELTLRAIQRPQLLQIPESTRGEFGP